MAAVDYTLVLGVDRRHLVQLSWTIQSWKQHKPSLWDVPWCVFYDHTQLTVGEVQSVVGRAENRTFVAWPAEEVPYSGEKDGPKWQRPQRHKMLAGFLHVPAMAVHTPYWLKLDTDVVAYGQDDWIQGSWFDDQPAIVAHRWSFTKPGDQMVLLDQWVEANRESLFFLAQKAPLNIQPEPGSDRVGHRRIISWCGFFDTGITRYSAECATKTEGPYQMPVPSQDGFAWYIARRLELPILRTNMKALGWRQWSSDSNVKAGVLEALRKCH